MDAVEVEASLFRREPALKQCAVPLIIVSVITFRLHFRASGPPAIDLRTNDKIKTGLS
ncbi:hypothetical protein BDI4_1080066 [Burkholderia diffusa]|nr:hypothetical protein BDI4_1080066 [Burkholderia diffusa]